MKNDIKKYEFYIINLTFIFENIENGIRIVVDLKYDIRIF